MGAQGAQGPFASKLARSTSSSCACVPCSRRALPREVERETKGAAGCSAWPAVGAGRRPPASARVTPTVARAPRGWAGRRPRSCPASAGSGGPQIKASAVPGVAGIRFCTQINACVPSPRCRTQSWAESFLYPGR